jgi:hypothetical protein
MQLAGCSRCGLVGGADAHGVWCVARRLKKETAMDTGSRSVFATAAWLTVGCVAWSSSVAAPVLFVVDPSQSTLSTTLEISGASDSDSSPLSGFVELDLDDPAAPSAASLLDFSVQADEVLNYNVSFGIFGAFIASISDATVFFDGTAPVGPVGVASGNASFLNVPALQSGVGTYEATGLACTTLQQNNLPCTDTFNLADEGQTIIPQIDGTISQSGSGELRLDVGLTFTSELDPDSPGLGSFSFTVDAVAFATLPEPACPGDVNGDGSVNGADLVALLSNFGSATSDGQSAGDLDGSGAVDGADLVALLSVFGSSCG